MTRAPIQDQGQDKSVADWDGVSRGRFNAKPYARCLTSPCHPVLSPSPGISGHRSRVESHA